MVLLKQRVVDVPCTSDLMYGFKCASVDHDADLYDKETKLPWWVGYRYLHVPMYCGLILK